MLRRSIGALRAVLFAIALFGLLGIAQRSAEAKCSATKEVPTGSGKTKKVPRIGKPERAFGGQVLTSVKRFPTSASSESAYIGSVRKQVERKFWEDKKNKSWKIHFIAFFKKPLDDMEVSIKLWDISTGVKHMLGSFEQYLDRCATSYASNIVLEREKFGVNKEILITVESRRVVIASGKFKILGEAEKYKGKVDFSDEEEGIPPSKPADDGDGDDDDDDDDARKTAAAEPEVPPEDDPEALDLDDPTLDEAPSLDPRTEMTESPPKVQKSSHGCGCAAQAGDHGPGGLLLLVLVWGVLRRRPAGSRG